MAIQPDGEIKWKFPLKHAGDPVIGNDGTIYLTGGDGLYAIDRNGTLKWTSTAGAVLYPVIANDGTLYQLTLHQSYNELHALDPKGKEKWKINTLWETATIPSIGSDGTVYLATGHYLYAFTPGGKEKWKVQIPSKSLYVPDATRPIISKDGTIIVGFPRENSIIYAFDQNGKEKWKIERKGKIRNLALGGDGFLIATLENEDKSNEEVIAFGSNVPIPLKNVIVK
jgi:outer membrane protein assembly factor BamB